MKKLASSNNNNKIDLSPSVEQHHKHNQSNKDKQCMKGTNTPKIVNLVRSNMIYSGGESSSQIH